MGNQYPPKGGNVSETKSTLGDYGRSSSPRSHPHPFTSSDASSFNVNHTNVQNPNVQYQTRNGPLSSDSQYPQSQYSQSYAAPAFNSRQRHPLTAHNLYVNHNECVDPFIHQQREQQRYASQVAAAQSLGIDMSNPAFASVAYAAEPGPRYPLGAPWEEPRREESRREESRREESRREESRREDSRREESRREESRREESRREESRRQGSRREESRREESRRQGSRREGSNRQDRRGTRH